MVDRTTYLNAIPLVDYTLIDILNTWIMNEKINLDHFIANPQGHVNYNPYMIINYTALNQRSAGLGQVSALLYEISQYKQGNPNYVGSQCDYAFDNIPAVIFQRLLDWLAGKANEMNAFIAQNQSSELAPINEYNGLFTFDINSYMNELTTFQNGVNGLTTIIEYKNQFPQLNGTSESNSSSNADLS